MQIAPPTTITVEDFDIYALQPENSHRRLEFIGQEVVELVSNRRSSKAGVYLAAAIVVFVQEHHLGEVTGADGGYEIGTERYMPDVAFTSTVRAVGDDDAAYYPFAPDLAVEVLSPNDNLRQFRIKLSNYLAAGTTVWVLDPDTQTAEVHAPNQPVQLISKDGFLTGGTILPGFSIALTTIFR
jgi:Uma2 family endonuclease